MNISLNAYGSIHFHGGSSDGKLIGWFHVPTFRISQIPAFYGLFRRTVDDTLFARRLKQEGMSFSHDNRLAKPKGGAVLPGVSVVGREPLSTVYRVEDHDEAFHLWQEHGCCGRVVVHIDAHHDMSPDSRRLRIGNYVNMAVRAGMVRSVWWVVPDSYWKTWATLLKLERMLYHLATSHGSSKPLIKHIREGKVMTVQLPTVPLQVCPMRSLPNIEEPVLLDVDIDFFTADESDLLMATGLNRRPARLPLCLPHELLAHLSRLNLPVEIATICYSVRGGYCPLRWRFLGDTLAEQLTRNPTGNAVVIAREALIYQGAHHAIHGFFVSAERKFRVAVSLEPSRPEAYFHLAHLYAQHGASSEAEQYFSETICRDASYDGTFLSEGTAYANIGDWALSKISHSAALRMSPQNAYAKFGLAFLFERERNFRGALQLCNQAIARRPDFTEAYYLRARLLRKTGDMQGALLDYQRCVALAREVGWAFSHTIAAISGGVPATQISMFAILSEQLLVEVKLGLLDAAKNTLVHIKGCNLHRVPISRVFLLIWVAWHLQVPWLLRDCIRWLFRGIIGAVLRRLRYEIWKQLIRTRSTDILTGRLRKSAMPSW